MHILLRRHLDNPADLIFSKRISALQHEVSLEIYIFDAHTSCSHLEIKIGHALLYLVYEWKACRFCSITMSDVLICSCIEHSTMSEYAALTCMGMGKSEGPLKQYFNILCITIFQRIYSSSWKTYPKHCSYLLGSGDQTNKFSLATILLCITIFSCLFFSIFLASYVFIYIMSSFFYIHRPVVLGPFFVFSFSKLSPFFLYIEKY